MFLLIFLLGLDLALRIAGFEFNPYVHYDPAGGFSHMESKNRVHYEPDHYLFWRFQPDQVIEDWWVPAGARINSQGVRGGEFLSEKPPGVFRIVCLGDSGTFGWQVADDETFPAKLQARLERVDPSVRWEVVNAGVPGYTSLQGLRFIETEALDWSPDLVVIRFGRNESRTQSKVRDSSRPVRHPALWEIDAFLLKSRIYQAMSYILVRGRLPEGSSPAAEGSDPEGEGREDGRAGENPPDPRATPEEHEKNLERMIRLVSDRGGKSILVFRYCDERYAEATRRVAERTGTPLVDFAGWSKEDARQAACRHPVPNVYGLMAEDVARAMEHMGLVKSEADQG